MKAHPKTSTNSVAKAGLPLLSGLLSTTQQDTTRTKRSRNDIDIPDDAFTKRLRGGIDTAPINFGVTLPPHPPHPPPLPMMLPQKHEIRDFISQLVEDWSPLGDFDKAPMPSPPGFTNLQFMAMSGLVGFCVVTYSTHFEGDTEHVEAWNDDNLHLYKSESPNAVVLGFQDESKRMAFVEDKATGAQFAFFADANTVKSDIPEGVGNVAPWLTDLMQTHQHFVGVPPDIEGADDMRMYD